MLTIKRQFLFERLCKKKKQLGKGSIKRAALRVLPSISIINKKRLKVAKLTVQKITSQKIDGY